VSDNRNKIINIKAVGDICPGDKYIMGLGVLNKTILYGEDFPMKKLGGVLQNADIVLANLEGLLSEKVRYPFLSNLSFCGLPGFAYMLKSSGINVINIANNHTFEHGNKIFIETVDILRQSGIHVCGLRDRTQKYYSEPVILTLKSKRIGIIGYNWISVDNFPEADEYIAQSHDSLVNYTWDREKKSLLTSHEANRHVKDDIKALRNVVDLVILMTHWGFEYVTIPPFHLTLEARSFIDAGAHIIIGGHPHVLQGFERYNNGLICYSLGNFIFDTRAELLRKTAVLDIDLKDDDISVNYIPYHINPSYQPEPATQSQAQSIHAILARSNQSILSPEKERLLDDDEVYRQYERYYNVGKIMVIINHFIAIREDLSVIRLILRKGISFFQIIRTWIKGNKVRW
jgi:gamma-polyglutamate biosynthesis protein CapA